jgi:hypothetical protein
MRPGSRTAIWVSGPREFQPGQSRGSFMQTLAAYLIFLLVVVAAGLATIVAAVAALAILEGIAWFKDHPVFRRWGSMVIKPLTPAGVRIEQEFHNLQRAIRAQLFQASHRRAQ